MAIPTEQQLIKFKNFVHQFVEPTEQEWNFITERLELKYVSKKTLLLQAGQVCESVSFVNKGLFRAYKLVHGKEVTHYFPVEGFFATDYSSFINRVASPDTIEALEDSEVLLLKHEAIHHGYEKYHVWERFGRLMAEFLYIKLEKTIQSFQLMTPEERYLKLMEEEPSLFERAPQQYLASFLGIAPESLSRIRKRITTIKV